MISRVKPGQQFPIASLNLLDNSVVTLSSWMADASALLVIAYRGVQCSFCRKQLSEFDRGIEEVLNRNVNVIAVSVDTLDRARQMHDELALENLQLAHSLDLDVARRCGLYISEKRKESEMPMFTEPGIFLVRPDETLANAWISTYAFPRVPFEGILDAIDHVLSTDPNLTPRGSV